MTDDYKDLEDKLATHINRHKIVCTNMLEYGSRVSEFITQIAIQLPKEGRDKISSELRLYADSLEDLSEVILLIGKDLEEIGEKVRKDWRESHEKHD
jgi:hypothetical protein